MTDPWTHGWTKPLIELFFTTKNINLDGKYRLDWDTGGKFIHSFVYTFIHSHIDSLTHSFIHSRIHSCPYSFIHSRFHAFIHTFIHTFIDSSTHSFIHIFIHSFVYAFIHSRIYSFTHSFTHLLPSRKNARHLVSLATVRVSKQKTPAVTGNTAGENASCMTDNRRRFHRQVQPLPSPPKLLCETNMHICFFSCVLAT